MLTRIDSLPQRSEFSHQITLNGVTGELWGGLRVVARGKNKGKHEVIIAHQSLGNRRDPTVVMYVDPDTTCELVVSTELMGFYFRA